MPVPTGFERAYLQVEGGSQIKCWFNPKDYQISKANTWQTKPQTGRTIGIPQFTGGQPRELTLSLLFDAADSDTMDVIGVTNELFAMMDVSQKVNSSRNSGRPPTVTFGWGQVLSFTAVAVNLSVHYTMFRVDGSPIRATAQLTLRQVAPMVTSSSSGNTDRQNPTTTGVAGLRTHVVRDGDSLQSIAYATYGDATAWRTIAEANGIDDPVRLRRGANLSLPGSPA